MFSSRLATKLAAAALVVSLAASLGSCAPARRPSPPPKTAPPAPETTPKQTVPGPAQKPLPTTPAEMDRLVSALATEATKVPGVKQATVVISGTTALVGLTLSPNVTGTQATNVKRDVANRIRRAEPRLTGVNVTSSPDLVSRIQKVAEGIKAGTPLSSFAKELDEIGRRIAPTPPAPPPAPPAPATPAPSR